MTAADEVEVEVEEENNEDRPRTAPPLLRVE